MAMNVNMPVSGDSKTADSGVCTMPYIKFSQENDCVVCRINESTIAIFSKAKSIIGKS